MNDLAIDASALARLCASYGIATDYRDVFGVVHRVAPGTQRALLAAMGVKIDNPADIEAAWRARTATTFGRRLPPVYVVRTGEAISLPVNLPQGESQLRWRLVLEEGEVRTGVTAVDFSGGTHEQLEGATFLHARVALPVAPPLGYHEFTLERDDAEEAMPLIVVPTTCYLPPAFERGERRLGLAVQLYALRSEQNFGIGDFGDLKRLVEGLAPRGFATVGLNPLHALFPHNPEHASPYSPSSRNYLNVWYLDVSAMPDVRASAAAQALLNAPEFAARLNEARRRHNVDYVEVALLKLPVLQAAYRHFLTLDAAHERVRAFRDYVQAMGESLKLQSIYEALQAYLHGRDRKFWGWPVWPQEYRSPMLPAVKAFAEAHAQEVEFYAYLQWQADVQLGEAAQAARSAGMEIGLYRDLAVGVDIAGAEAWAHQGLYAHGATVGCPPDEFNLKGQNWGLPPYVPGALRDAGYAPYIATLRANMRHAGALRIDHVMGLLRLFWVPPGEDAAAGAYVHYPLDDLLGILALESQRHRCLVVGEDLGTVPAEIRAALNAARVLSYKVFYFERGADGNFLAPRDYAQQALVAVTTHDLATLPGFWSGADLEERAALRLFPSPALEQAQRAAREQDRERLLAALQEEGLLPDLPPANGRLPATVLAAVYAYIARTPSFLMLVQAEDLQGDEVQVNLPGTTSERPNWRRRWAFELEEFLTSATLKAVAHTACERRG